MTTEREVKTLVVLTLVYVFTTLTGSFITTGNIYDLLLILTLVCYLIQFAILKKKEKKK